MPSSTSPPLSGSQHVATGLASCMRGIPPLGAGDSVSRALLLMTQAGVDALPVVDARGRLIGSVDLAGFSADGAAPDPWPMLDPVGAHLAANTCRIAADRGRTDAALDLRAAARSTGFVVDGYGRYVGVVWLPDLLCPPAEARPGPIGGMATPWGVHLSYAGISAGPGSWALVAGGAVLGGTLAIAHLLVGVSAHVITRLGLLDLAEIWSAASPPIGDAAAGAAWSAMQAASLLLFLGLLRVSRLARYHGAEHQVVHAVERGEPLVVSVVQRMPRVHMRCGTNLIAGVALFTMVSHLVALVGLAGGDAASGAPVGAVAALFLWRRLGAVLQGWFTTRPPRDGEVQSAIDAANALCSRHREQSPVRPVWWRRLWAIGAPQTMLGVAVGTGAGITAAEYLLLRLF